MACDCECYSCYSKVYSLRELSSRIREPFSFVVASEDCLVRMSSGFGSNCCSRTYANTLTLPLSRWDAKEFKDDVAEGASERP